MKFISAKERKKPGKLEMIRSEKPGVKKKVVEKKRDDEEQEQIDYLGFSLKDPEGTFNKK